MNILDYLDERGTAEFGARPFNEVDSLILSELAYLRMDGIISAEKEEFLTPEELLHAYLLAGCDQSDSSTDPLPLLKKAAFTPRFASMRIGWYENRVEQDLRLQFSAVTFFLPDQTIFIAFRGTDDTLVGWREDFSFSYLSGTGGQLEAVRYVNHAAERTTCPIRIGGHSKGGNFAVYGAAFCRPEVKERILRVYSNDGPGFHNAVAESEEYLGILDRVEKYIPEASIVGNLLSGKEKARLVKSEGKGVWQHNPYTWSVEGDHFVPAPEQSSGSLAFNETIQRWLEHLSGEQREKVVTAIFDSLEASGAETFREMSENRLASYSAILKAASKLAPDLQKEWMGSMVKLASSGVDTLLGGFRKSMEKIELPDFMTGWLKEEDKDNWKE